MFSCKVCKEKDERIADLKQQITLLASLSIPKPQTFKAEMQSMEADAVIEGRSDPIEIDLRKQEEIDREAMNILTGNYDEQRY